MGALLRWIAGRWGGRKARLKLDREIELKVQLANVCRARVLADPILSPLERMIQWWDTGAAHGASDKDLSALEDKYAIRLPEDFRAYLKAVMPEGNQWDHDGTKWWPLNEIKTVQEECKEWPDQYPPTGNGDKQLVFADWLIWCYGWAIDCSETENRGRVLKVVDGDEYVATSFNDFLDRYLRKDHSIYG